MFDDNITNTEGKWLGGHEANVIDDLMMRIIACSGEELLEGGDWRVWEKTQISLV